MQRRTSSKMADLEVTKFLYLSIASAFTYYFYLFVYAMDMVS